MLASLWRSACMYTAALLLSSAISSECAGVLPLQLPANYDAMMHPTDRAKCDSSNTCTQRWLTMLPTAEST